MKRYLKSIPALLIVFLSCLAAHAQTESWTTAAARIGDKTARAQWLIHAASDSPAYVANDLQMLEMALKLAEELASDTLRAKAFYRLGNYDKKVGDLVSAWKDYQYSKIYFIKARYFDAVVKVLYNQGQVLMFQGLTDSCIRFLERNEMYLRLSSDEKTKLYITSLHGIAFMKDNNPEKAQEVFFRLLPLAEERKDTQMIISTYINIGLVQEDFDSSLAWYRKGMNYAEGRSPAKYVELLIKIGFLYNKRDDARKDSALHYLLEAEKNAHFLSDPIHKVHLLNTIGDFFYAKGEYPLALSYMQKGLVQSKGLLGKHRNILLNNLALTFFRLGQMDSANYYLQLYSQAIQNSQDDYEHLLYYQSRASFATYQSDSCAWEVTTNIAEAFRYAVKLKDARLGHHLFQLLADCLLKKAPGDKVAAGLARTTLQLGGGLYEQMKTGENLAWLAVVLENYAALEVAYGSSDKARVLYKELAEVLKRMNNEHYLKGLDEALVKYKSDLKDTQIALLVEQERAASIRTRLIIVGLLAVAFISVLIFILYKRERKSKHLLDERNHKVEQLLREIHHRVKNNLQIVSSFINIQLDKIRDQASRQALIDTSARIMALAGLHQSLYRQDNYAQIQVDEYIRDLCDAIGNNMNQDIKISCELQKLRLDIDQAIPVGLAVNELITNALKHAFTGRDRGNIHIRLEKKERWELSVKDNGKGLPENMNPIELDSIGIRLVQDIAETQLKGTFSFHNEGGAVFQIAFTPQAA